MHVSTQQLQFAPVSRNITNMGTTVTYSTNRNRNFGVNAYSGGISQGYGIANQNQGYGINAVNSGMISSGNFSSFPQTQYGYNVQPSITANQFGQVTSGNIVGRQGYISNNQLFGDVIVQPSVDISETSSDVIVTAHVPHVTNEDMTLNVTDNSVTMSAHTFSGNQSLVLNRTVALPTSVRAESVDASLQSGVLEVRLPKAEKQSRKRNTLSQQHTQGNIQQQ